MKSLFLCLVLAVSVNSHRYTGPRRINLGTRILQPTFIGSTGGAYYQSDGLSGLYGSRSSILYGNRGYSPLMSSFYYRSRPSFSYQYGFPRSLTYGELGLSSGSYRSPGFDFSDDEQSFGLRSSRFGYSGAAPYTGRFGSSSFGVFSPYSSVGYRGSSSLGMRLSGTGMNLGDLSNRGFGDTSINNFGEVGAPSGFGLFFGNGDGYVTQGPASGMSSGGIGYRSFYGPLSYYSRSSFVPMGRYYFGRSPGYISTRSVYGPTFSRGMSSSSLGLKEASDYS